LAALQPRYNLLTRPYERDLLPLCRATGIGVVPYDPLGAGMLTGKYRRGEPVPEESRFALGDYGLMYQGRYWQDAMFDVAEAVTAVGKEEGMTPAQVAIGWLLAQEGLTSPIVGASRPEQLRDSAGALDKSLSAESMQRLDEASRRFR